MLAANDATAHAEVDRLAALLLAQADAAGASGLAALAPTSQSHSLYRRSRFGPAAQEAHAALQAGRHSGAAEPPAEGLVGWARVQWAGGVACVAASMPPTANFCDQGAAQRCCIGAGGA